MLIVSLPATLLLIVMICVMFLNFCRRTHQCLNRFLAYSLKLSRGSITSVAFRFGSQNSACIMLVVLLLCALLLLELLMLLVLFLFFRSVHASGLIIIICDLAITTAYLIFFWWEHRLWCVSLWRSIILFDELLMSDASTATLSTSTRRNRSRSRSAYTRTSASSKV